MATAAVTYPNFINGVDSDADQIDQNYADIVAFLNGSVVHVDGTKSMTGLLTLAASDPTSDNHAVRKSYLDGAYVEATGVVAQNFVSGTPKTIVFDTEVADTAGAYVLGTGVFTAPKTGVYLISWGAVHVSGSTVVHRMRVLRNSVDAFTGPQIVPNLLVTTESPRLTMSMPIKLTSGQTLEPQMTLLSTTTQSLGAWLTIAWLHG